MPCLQLLCRAESLLKSLSKINNLILSEEAKTLMPVGGSLCGFQCSTHLYILYYYSLALKHDHELVFFKIIDKGKTNSFGLSLFFICFRREFLQ